MRHGASPPCLPCPAPPPCGIPRPHVATFTCSHACSGFTQTVPACSTPTSLSQVRPPASCPPLLCPCLRRLTSPPLGRLYARERQHRILAGQPRRDDGARPGMADSGLGDATVRRCAGRAGGEEAGPAWSADQGADGDGHVQGHAHLVRVPTSPILRFQVEAQRCSLAPALTALSLGFSGTQECPT